MTNLDTVLSRYDEALIALAYDLRQLVLDNLPGAVEEVDAPAHMLAYGMAPGYKGSVCTIIPSKKELKLGLYKGAGLPDPAGLLQGTGKVHRYVVIKSKADVHNPELRALLHRAAEACAARLGKG